MTYNMIILRIYELLEEHAGASPTHEAWRQFQAAFTRPGGCREYRFGGSLGFGGKLYNDGQPWRVGCYREDETPERLAAIEATNEALKSLWDATGH